MHFIRVPHSLVTEHSDQTKRIKCEYVWLDWFEEDAARQTVQEADWKCL